MVTPSLPAYSKRKPRARRSFLSSTAKAVIVTYIVIKLLETGFLKFQDLEALFYLM